MSSVQKFKTYALTIRPRNGIDNGALNLISDWIRKRCEFYHIITEKTGHERHVHAALFLKMPITKSNMNTLLVRLAKDSLGFDPEELTVLRKGVKILYSNDFIENYLDKDDDTEVVQTNLPATNHLDSWYPPKPIDPETSKQQKHSHYYWELERLWYMYMSPTYEVNTKTVRDFLFNMMYSERCINVIRDDKTIVQTARHLVRWINKTTTNTIELAPFEQEE